MGTFNFTVIDAPHHASWGTILERINDAGVIAGYTNYSFTWSAGAFATLQLPGTGGCVAGGPNDAGQFVGIFDDGKGEHGFVYGNGTYTTLDAPPGGRPSGINNPGQIVGIYGHGNGPDSFLDTAGTFTTISDPMAVVRPGFVYGTFAEGINDAGAIVGWYTDSIGNYHGFLDRNGAFTSINVPAAHVVATVVSGINNAGEMVGWYQTSYEYPNNIHGFIDNNGTFTTVNYPGAMRTFLIGVNDSGAIAGYYEDYTYALHGLLIVPAGAVHWAGGSGAFNNAACWTPQLVPGANDDVSIDAAGTYSVTAGTSETVRTLAMAAGARWW